MAFTTPHCARSHFHSCRVSAFKYCKHWCGFQSPEFLTSLHAIFLYCNSPILQVQPGDGLSSKNYKRIFGLRKRKSNNCSQSWGGNKGSSGDLTNNANLVNSSPNKNNIAQETESPSSISVSYPIIRQRHVFLMMENGVATGYKVLSLVNNTCLIWTTATLC